MTQEHTRGYFITLEGIEGVGKSVQAEYLRGLLSARGHRVCFTREPGGTPAGEAIRDLLLHVGSVPVDGMAELLLIFAARAQHLAQIIRPALDRGDVVICDRFTDATYAYQGGGRGIDQDRIRLLEDLVQQGMCPDLTLLLDTDVQTGLARANRRGTADRFESETVEFFQRVRSEYLELAARQPDRVCVIDAGRDIGTVQDAIRVIIEDRGLC